MLTSGKYEFINQIKMCYFILQEGGVEKLSIASAQLFTLFDFYQVKK